METMWMSKLHSHLMYAVNLSMHFASLHCQTLHYSRKLSFNLKAAYFNTRNIHFSLIEIKCDTVETTSK